MVNRTKKNKALIEKKQDDNFQIKKEIYNEISSVMLQKSKLRSSSWFLATKDKVAFLLKKGSMLEWRKAFSNVWITIFQI